MFLRSELLQQLRYILLRIKAVKAADACLTVSDADVIQEFLQQWYSSLLED